MVYYQFITERCDKNSSISHTIYNVKQIIQQIRKVRTTCGQHNIRVLKCSHSEATAIIDQVIKNPSLRIHEA